MRIDGFQNIPAILQSFKVDKSLKSRSESESKGSSSVSLSSFGAVLQSLQRESAQASKIRTTQVEQLAEQAQAGKLSVDVTNLASRLIDLQVIDTKG
ncbi:MAG TPA: flagellar biosynthesis anti-sigma factor FlgM [bacterium]